MATQQELQDIVTKVLQQMGVTANEAAPASAPASAPVHADSTAKAGSASASLVIDLDDPTTAEARAKVGVVNPYDLDGLINLKKTTTARLGVGRAGHRPLTQTALLFQADHGVAQDAIYGEVDQDTLDKLGLFTITSSVPDRATFLLRPDHGRMLSDEAKQTLRDKCVSRPDVQIVVGDGLSVAGINHNLPDIFPVLTQGLERAGLKMGTPFFVENCRVGIMNDINDIIQAKVIVLLIGERPGLGIADAMSAYMGFEPKAGKSDADRDLICMITTGGGVNPLEAGAYVVEFVQKMMKYQASGVSLSLQLASGEKE